MTKITSEKAPSSTPKNKGGRPKGSTKPNSEKKSINQALRSKNWRIVIPNLQQLKDASPEALLQLKYQTLDRILSKEKSKHLQHYSIAIQKHLNGVPHLDVLLIYSESVRFNMNHFDYILKHGNITTYRNLNQAILDYNKKQDQFPLSNLPQDSSEIINLQQLKKDPYRYLELKMLEDPLHFNLQQYVRSKDVYHHIKGWSSLKTKLKDSQTAAANLKLKSMPGFKFISRQLIESSLSPDQLRIFDSWSGYQTIINYLNELITQKGNRQMKSKNLLITGSPNIGKTSLFSNPNHKSDKSCVEDFCAVYPMGMTHWFPKYQSNVYHMILWNQMKLSSYQYTTILKFLEGSYMDLPHKGGSSRKVDNPLIIMTSNMTLDQMIKQKFGYNLQYQNLAQANLSVRIQNIIVPKGYDLFLLQKLLKP